MAEYKRNVCCTIGNIQCPYCRTLHISRYDWTDGEHEYLCEKCKRLFSIVKATITMYKSEASDGNNEERAGDD